MHSSLFCVDFKEIIVMHSSLFCVDFKDYVTVLNKVGVHIFMQPAYGLCCFQLGLLARKQRYTKKQNCCEHWSNPCASF